MTEAEFKLLKIGDRVKQGRHVYQVTGRVTDDPNRTPYFRSIDPRCKAGISGPALLLVPEEIERLQPIRSHDYPSRTP